MAPILKIESLSYRYDNAGVPIFSDFSFDVKQKEFVAIVGGSGVGKSTILRCIAGLLPPTDGHITLTGEPIPGTRRKAIVFQDGRLLPWRSVADNVGYGLEGLALTAAEKRARISEALQLTMLSDYSARWPHQLSGGQAQRVGIARALALKPSLLLMDEPFSAVDALTRETLQDELVKIWHATQAAILFITHDIHEAVFLADRILVLRGSPAHIVVNREIELERPRNRGHSALYSIAKDISDHL